MGGGPFPVRGIPAGRGGGHENVGCRRGGLSGGGGRVAIQNFATNKFVFNTTQFGNMPGGRFAVATNGLKLQIVYIGAHSRGTFLTLR